MQNQCCSDLILHSLYEAYKNSPQCGNDDWQGSIEVVFDKDKSLSVSANRGSNLILDFANNADYESLKKSMNRFMQDNSVAK